jgi:hypothetical protein
MCEICIINLIQVITFSRIVVVSSVDTRAQSYDLEPVSVAAEAENRSKP